MIAPSSNGDRRRDVRMRFVILQSEIVGFVAEQPLSPVLDHQARQFAWLTRELQPRLIEMVGIEMTIAAGPDEHAGVEAALSRQHVREECIGGDVERDAKKDVGAALIELQVETSARDLRLKEAMARRQGHAVDLTGIPGGDDLPPRVRIAFD